MVSDKMTQAMTPNPTSYKSVSVTLVTAVFCLLMFATAPSCGPETDNLSTVGRDATAGSAQSPGPRDDWGTDWDRSKDRGSAGSTAGASTVWTIVLATFPAETGAHAAAGNMVTQLRTLAPQLDELWVHPTGGGAMVVSGRYDSAQSPDAQAALRRIKAVQIQEQPAFTRAMLSRVTVPPAVPDAAHVGARQHGMHAGEPLRLRGIDTSDTRVGEGAAEHLAPQHAGQPHVGGVAGRSRGLTLDVGGRRLTDDAVRDHAFLPEGHRKGTALHPLRRAPPFTRCR